VKLIPCAKCGREAVGPATSEYPSGAPVVFGRYTGGGAPIVVKCHRCTMSFKVDEIAYARIPELNLDQMRQLGLV
jgi:hypothetical protein